MFKSIRICLLLLAICLLNHKCNSQQQQQQVCTIESAVLYPGKTTISQQSVAGFCKEWIIGPVTRNQRIFVSFLNADIKCNGQDKLLIYNEDRSFLLYDYCIHKSPDPTGSNFVMANAKYLIARMQTPTANYMSVTFDMVLLDPTSPGMISTIQPAILLPTLPPFIEQQPSPQPPQQSLMPSLKEEICPTNPKEITDSFGSIKSPSFKMGQSVNANCFWLIKAPPNQRVYLVFDFINLPSNMFGLDSFGCGMNYLTIASQNKPNEFFKLCGQRNGVKLITTYNNVLINLVTSSLRDINAGFSLAFRIISDPSALMPSTPSAQFPTSPFPSPQQTITPTSVGGNFECGVPSNKPNDPLAAVMRIVGGTESVPHSWPWQVMITDGSIMCGGSLINNYWIVTAAHCTENINNGPIKAYIGMHNRLRSEPSKIVRAISRVVIHPNYLGRLTQWDFDIALMKLQDPVTFSEDISPICLPPQGVNMAKLGARGIVTGWGDTQGTGQSYILRQTSITVKKNAECGASSENMLCAGEKVPELHDSCQGDSGGPFVMKNDNHYYLVGLVSWGYDCNGAGVYTKVSNFVNWIKSVASTF